MIEMPRRETGRGNDGRRGKRSTKFSIHHSSRVMFSGIALLILAAQSHSVVAGAFIFAESFADNNGIFDTITHPSGYSGFGGELDVKVCIVPGTPNDTALQEPVRNIVATWNKLQPSTHNLRFNVVSGSQLDFESVALHELGHCIGLAHPNLASESGLSGANTNYTKSTRGPGANPRYDLNAGADGVRGSADDLRGNDVNLHWFRTDNNNPFSVASIVDLTTYARELALLPAGDSFAANADRTVSLLPRYSAANTEAIMQQGSVFGEIQRTLGHDDVASIRFAMSGLDKVASTADDYTINLVYGGISDTDCDINLSLSNSISGLAYCGVSGTVVDDSPPHRHVAITGANAYFSTAYKWDFNPNPGCSGSFSLPTGSWQQISLPCQMGISTSAAAQEVFSDLDGTYGTDWSMYKWDHSDGGYSLVGATEPLEEGRGYWIRTTLANQSAAVGGEYSSQVDVLLDSEETSGAWNMVGNPFRYAVNWADAKVIDTDGSVLSLDDADPVAGATRACDAPSPGPDCLLSHTAHIWNGNAYDSYDGGTPGAEGVFDAFDGFWVKAYKPGIALRIPMPAAESSSSEVLMTEAPAEVSARSFTSETVAPPRKKEQSTVRMLAQEGWYVRLIAESEGMRDAGNVLGQLPDSIDGADLHDLRALDPFGSPYLDLIFPHEDWGDHAGDYTTDFRALHPRLQGKWAFEVHSSVPDSNVTLRWEGPGEVIERAVLVDLNGEKRRRINLQPDGSYTFTMKGNSARFLWKQKAVR